MGLLTPQMMHDKILTLYQEVYQPNRAPGEVQCLDNTAEETHIKILETLWCRWGSAQPEREVRRDTPRMPAQATYHYLGCHCRRQQESQEKTLQFVRDYHHQALAAAAVLEGHIEWLSHSITQGLYGRQNGRQLGGSHWQSGSRRDSRNHGHSRSHRRCSPSWLQELTPQAEGCPGDAARRQTDSPSLIQARRQTDSPSLAWSKKYPDSPGPVWAKWWVTFEGANLDSSLETTLKSVDWSQQVEEDNSPFYPVIQTRPQKWGAWLSP